MLGLRTFLIHFVIMLQSMLVVASQSLSIAYISGEECKNVDSMKILASQSNIDRPLVILQFDKFAIYKQYSSSNKNYPYLTKYFEHDLNQVLPLEKDFKVEDYTNSEIIKLEQLPSSVSEILYTYPLRENFVIAIDFESAVYDLDQLDGFLESVTFFLDEYLPQTKVLAIISPEINVNSKKSISKKEEEEEEEAEKEDYKTETEEEYVNDNSEEDKDEVEAQDKKGKNKEDKEEDSDILSTIWTEGLLMCLLVSALLLGILFIAISWLASLEISYGALEKSTNPLKKTN
ncbi:hypothetical protein Kpol_359p3 [Vanderwaltozyma polyspora DSM 70294]|uniref:V-type proton ATPase subunit S1/VOA1 transmembrane domain-containing protein n=1 Tax=Vanderwaltozyma polyspora (strain ATCC 22028 / DSM 70294 / BCRC 21397 / CBS 2163 / NBRC 10782 / NRRL Y-8283 / UCD 57-17) TaxID=436907 RepID=A7TSA6_VANPO|nr:uncharacterized protein Kpol_359p3 [Vanderwaltozyma polyspora DSM 70294]EDO14843.1 hypothetical protein Kpol_359p3 [Vanderwaltozyma polyspora DSM 70294]